MCHLAVKQNNISILALLASYRYFFRNSGPTLRIHFVRSESSNHSGPARVTKIAVWSGHPWFLFQNFISGWILILFQKHIWRLFTWLLKEEVRDPRTVFRSSIFKRTKRSGDPWRKCRTVSYSTPKWCKNRCPNKPWTDATDDCCWTWSQWCCCSSSQVIHLASVWNTPGFIL